MIVLNDQKLHDRKRYHFVIEKRAENEFIGGIGYTVR